MNLVFNRCEPQVFAVINKDVSFYTLESHAKYSDCEIIHPNLFLTTVHNMDARCVEWHPSMNHENVIAMGHANGSVVLKSVSSYPSNQGSSLDGKEFVPKNQKQCNDLAWNKFSTSSLAVGLDRHPRQASLLVWDVNAKCTSDLPVTGVDRTKTSDQAPQQTLTLAVTKPTAEYGVNESVNSLVWVSTNHSKLLLAGMSKKCLRLYDVRLHQISQPSVINHKATMGLCVNPFYDNELSSYHDDTVVTWDLRHLTKPTASIQVSANVSKIEWSPTRRGMLAVLLTPHENAQESVESRRRNLCLYDVIKNAVSDFEFGQPIKRTANFTVPNGEWLSGFAWHPTAKNCFVTLGSSHSFQMVPVSERTTTSCQGYKNFGFVCGEEMHVTNQVLDFQDEEVGGEFIDMEEIMRRRSQSLYGLQENLATNVELSLEPRNLHLRLMWEWMKTCQTMEKLSQDQAQPNTTTAPNAWVLSRSSLKQEKSRKSRSSFFLGAKSLFKEDLTKTHAVGDVGSGDVRSSSVQVNWNGVSGAKSTVYKSTARDLILATCGWTNVDASVENLTGLRRERFGGRGLGEEVVRRLSVCGEVERACAVALWHLDVKLAIGVLNAASQRNDGVDKLPAVAMAMSGFSGANSSRLWIETCKEMQAVLSSGYLQMAFAFLIACADDKKLSEGLPERFEELLFNKRILLQDRVSFACIYLPDAILDNYLTTLAEQAVGEAWLDGLIVTGASTSMGVKLLQNHVDKTCDVQTATCVMMQAQDRDFLTNCDVLFWKESYTNLLNKWRFYNERVQFDLEWMKACDGARPTSQVYVYCNFCGKSISSQGTASGSSPQRPPPRTLSYSGCARSTPKKESHASFLHKCSALFSPVMYKGRILSTASDRGSCRGNQKVSPALMGRARGFMGSNLAMQNPITSCPSCRKPLPRCSVCSMHLGTRPKDPDHRNWLSWCMKCRHGGHQEHLDDWFQKFKQCPVGDCKCFCDSAPVTNPAG